MAVLAILGDVTPIVASADYLGSGDPRTRLEASNLPGSFDKVEFESGQTVKFAENVPKDIWIHFRYANNGASLNATAQFSLVANDGTYKLRIGSGGGDQFFLNTQQPGGGTASAPAQTAAVADIDVHFYNNRVAFYVDGNQIHDTTFSIVNATFNSIALVTHQPDVSEVIIADEDTRGWRLAKLDPEAAGSFDEFGGIVDSINTEDLTADSVSADGPMKQSFQYSDFSTDANAAGLQVHSLVLGSVVNTAGNPAAPIFRHMVTNGTDVGYGPNASAPDADGALAPQLDIMEVNPLTGNAWTMAEIDALEFGAESFLWDMRIRDFGASGSLYGIKKASGFSEAYDKKPAAGYTQFEYFYEQSDKVVIQATTETVGAWGDNIVVLIKGADTDEIFSFKAKRNGGTIGDREYWETTNGDPEAAKVRSMMSANATTGLWIFVRAA
ncbi:hypothetical protein [Vibrio phage vB_pir03]|nr:hypothetical protein [Vibrio phage vB_pir03]